MSDPIKNVPDTQLCSICQTLECSSCLDSGDLHDFMALTDAMVSEILRLEEEVVRWRQALIKHLEPRWADGLRQDIFDNLSRTFYGFDAYQLFINYMHGGVDPMESPDHVDRMLRLRDGNDETSITHL